VKPEREVESAGMCKPDQQHISVMLGMIPAMAWLEQEGTTQDVLSPRSRVFTEAEAMQLAEPKSQRAAEHVHTHLQPQFWGLSRQQLVEFVNLVREDIQKGNIVNLSKQQCTDAGHPEWYYDQAKFDNPQIGPNMHAVNGKCIKPWTMNMDPVRKIRKLSYSCMVNSMRGLICDLFISHAWDEGVFEFANSLLQKWPAQCCGAYICFLSNPQNLLDLIAKQIRKPTDSPFYKVLKNGPHMMMIVPNSNTPIHSRLWCVYEGYCAVTLKIPVNIAGDPRSMITDGESLKIAKQNESRRNRNRLFLLCFFVIGVMFAPPCAIIFPCVLYYIINKQKEQDAAEHEAKLKAVDVRMAKCSNAGDQEAISEAIRGREEDINAMVRGFIPVVSQQREPPSMLMRCLCPPCSVLFHEGPGCPLCLAVFMCQWFSVLCWSPKKFEGAVRDLKAEPEVCV